jgi:hypothetical protein
LSAANNGFLDNQLVLNAMFMTDSGSVLMPVTTLSSRVFNQDPSRAKRAAKSGPVFVTFRGRVAHVILSIDDYHKLTGVPVEENQLRRKRPKLLPQEIRTGNKSGAGSRNAADIVIKHSRPK